MVNNVLDMNIDEIEAKEEEDKIDEKEMLDIIHKEVELA